jgi:hypothetical protein
LTVQRSRDLLALVVMWLVVAAFELTKAVHVDDTAYLEVARAIIAHPLHPMSALLNWSGTALPIHKQNMPHLLLYLMAGVMKVAPVHFDLALHLVWALFSGLAMALFYQLARALDAPRPLIWTAIFCLGPAFIPSQNLMLDVPLVAVWLAFFYGLTRSEESRGLGAAAVLVAVACLVKYTSLVLVPILALDIVRRLRLGRCRPATLCLLLVPVGALVGWSLFNWFDYGGIHILERPIATGAIPALGRRLAVMAARGMLWVIALGAIAPFTLAFVGQLATSSAGRRLLLATAAIAAITSVIGRAALPAEPVVQSVLRGLFLANGILIAGLAARGRPQGGAVRGAVRGDGAAWRFVLLGLWAFGAALFIVVLSPFIAVRHVLLALPAILLLVARGPDAARLSPPALALACGLTAVVGVLVAASDARLANLYRREVPVLVARFCGPGVRCVAVGPWGWQWYASQAGLEIYDRQRTGLRPGDRLMVSELAGKEPVAPGDAARLRLIAQIEEPATPTTWVRTNATEKSSAQGSRSGGFYYFWTSVPWTITTRPLDRFFVYEVDSP